MIHTQNIRTHVRCVNVENENALCDLVYVPDEQTIGARLKALWQQSGLSMQKLAKAAGYSGASSIQRYLDDAYDPAVLPNTIATRLADAFEKTPVGRAPVLELAGYDGEQALDTVVRFEGASQERLQTTIPIFGTALGAVEEIDGEAIEQTQLYESTVMGYVSRPAWLNGRSDVYGVYIQGASMSPRYEQGEMVVAEKNKPPRIFDDVIVQLASPDDHDGDRVTAVMIKRLVRRAAAYIELEQFNPPKIFRVETDRVKAVHRVIPWSELLG
ncbi:XRE family transcriptional regulator [Sphingomonas sp. ABOLF]|uniref:LexA family transcriptional regulator n=1 Tax=Sphingomonas sp. ABOLF TaxID=1985879 RepID=UPI000F7DFC7D|nr:XRE family transcriptional regulator [Sphingomonas sp. ABOLF]RSV15656.1 XRE family transcriptional regulator [Sphingomonas sp. ABOLF]